MECKRCGRSIANGEERDFYGQILCEDCYMDRLSPSRACDPWAVHSAKSFLRETGGEAVLTSTQKRILAIIEETGGLEPKDLLERLRIGPTDLDREIATLRHMEKMRAELREGKKVLCPW